VERKNFDVEIKAIDEGGAVQAYIATYRSTPDHDNDIIEPGAFTKSLSGSPKIPMLWQHDTKQPCGHWFDYKTTGDGVLASGKFNLNTSWGRDAHGAVKGGDVTAFSIGYLTEQASFDKKGVRHLTELNLKEASPVTFAADDAAKLVSVKAEDDALETAVATLTELGTKAVTAGDKVRVQVLHDHLHAAHAQTKGLGASCLDGDYQGDGVPLGGDDTAPKSNRIPISAKALAEAVAKAIFDGNPKSTVKE